VKGSNIGDRGCPSFVRLFHRRATAVSSTALTNAGRISLLPLFHLLIVRAYLQAGTCTFQDYGFVINDHVEQATVPDDDQACEVATTEIPHVDGVFELLQFHIHAGSEHTLNGLAYGAELHLVHQQRGGDRLAVVGVFLTAGGDGTSNSSSSSSNSDLFSTVLARFDEAADETSALCGGTTASSHWWSSSSPQQQQQEDGDDASAAADDDGSELVDVYGLIPEGSAFYRYDGGLTTPPCTEIVDWSVADAPLVVSVAQFHDLVGLLLNYVDPDTCQLATIASPFGGTTSRPVQPLNGRAIQRICPVGYVDEEAAHRRFGAAGMAAAVATTALVVAAVTALVTIRFYGRRLHRLRPSAKESELLGCDDSSSSNNIDGSVDAAGDDYRLCIR
jgi:carbonic anhydrase